MEVSNSCSEARSSRLAAVALGAVGAFLGASAEEIGAERDSSPLGALVVPEPPAGAVLPPTVPVSDLRLMMALSSGQIGPVLDAHLQLRAREAALDAISERVPLERSTL